MWKKFKKYFFNRQALILYIALCIVLGISYIVTLYFENSYAVLVSSSDNVNNLQDIFILIDIIKNLSLTAFTIFLSTLLSGIIIEKKQRNEENLDAIINDVLFCEEFDKVLSDEHKELMYKRYIQSKYGQSNDYLLDMLESINDKLSSQKGEFFYDKCSFIINCTPKENYIEKNITRTIEIKSYEKQKELSNFVFASSALKQIQNEKVFEIKEIMLDGEALTEGEDYECISPPASSVFHKKSGYDVYNKCISKKKIVIENQKGVKISINYITKVDLTDNVYNCRVREHCRQFSMQFTINSAEKYDISPVAFGFIDDAQYTPNGNDSNSINLNFDNWIFKKDGVSINFKKKN